VLLITPHPDGGGKQSVFESSVFIPYLIFIENQTSVRCSIVAVFGHECTAYVHFSLSCLSYGEKTRRLGVITLLDVRDMLKRYAD
jgi:hypothetical protein